MGADVVTEYRTARRLLGVVPQELVFDPFFTVRETLRLQSGYFGIRANDGWIDEVMHHLDLTAKADANMRALSGGMKRRVLVAQALVHKPPVIVLDEPTAGVDVELRQGLWQFVRRLNHDGHTVVLTTHYLEEAEMHCSRIAMLKAGRIVALDSTHNLLSSVSGSRTGVRIVARDGAQHAFEIAGYGELEPLLARLRAQGIEIADIELERPDLETVFLRMTGRGQDK
jgi:ABC-2 type transport system ATP-binding protein